MRTFVWSLVLIAACIGGIASHSSAETAVAIPSFQEETKTSGIDSIYAGDWQYMVGGGAATFDCNDDGYPDMLLAGGEAHAKFYKNVSARGGVLNFERSESGLEFAGMTGAYPLDIDDDGHTDLVLLRVGENIVMRGLGGCRFERANELWGFDGGDAWSTALAAIWESGAEWPTIAVGNYVDRNQEMSPWGSCTDNWLHRPVVADGKAERRFAPPLPLKPSYCPLSMLFTDWNRSGTPSLRVSNDREYYEGGQEQLWRIDPGKPPSLYTAEEGWKFLRIWGMGIAGYDLNSDGYPEYFLTSMADNKLQALANIPQEGNPKPSYADIAFSKGVTAHRPYTGGDWHPSTAWHTQFEDVNNDGRVDLFIAKGNVAEMPDFAQKDPSNMLLQIADGKFQEAGDKAGIVSFATARGGALTDLNLDGLVDLVIVNRWESARLWRNTSANAGRWIQVKLLQPAPNREAIGAWLEVRCGEQVARREIAVGGGHAGGQSGWWHFGVADTVEPELRVIWPDGSQGEWQKVESNNFYVVERGQPPRPWPPN